MKIEIRRDWSFGGLEIIFWEERNGKIFVCKKMEWIWDEAQNGTFVEASLKLPFMSGEEFLKAMSDALSERGVKTDNDHKIQGTLEATKYHLEDLRNLLKIK